VDMASRMGFSGYGLADRVKWIGFSRCDLADMA
jgi:hypothetical protein